MTQPTAIDYMQQAVALAKRGWYTSAPNPRVGCVLVKDEQIIGRGWHHVAGQPHAEPRALADAKANGHDPAGATAYVTLEPCSHHGKTPPCADTLIQAGIEQVVLGAQDPNPKIDGAGIAKLKAAGVKIITGIEAAQCEALNPGFNQRMRTGRPRVRVKLAMTLDGRTAAQNGESQWITGENAREDVHRLRAESGAVLTGIGTVLADDPSLNVRLPGQWPQPKRVVLDSNLRTPATAKMLTLDGETRIYTRSDVDANLSAQLADAGAQVCPVAAQAGGRDLAAILQDLGQQEINDVLVEAGATLAGAFAQAGLVDEYIFYMAPQILGDSARGVLNLAGATRLADRLLLDIKEVTPVGPDWRITAYPKS